MTATCASAAGEVGRIKQLAGVVEIHRGAERIPAAVDAVVRASDSIVTGPGGKVGIVFSDGTRMSTGPNSRLVIDRYTFDATTQQGRFDTTLKRGTLAAISGRMAKQSPEAMTVRTPTLLLGVRGTEFLVRAE